MGKRRQNTARRPDKGKNGVKNTDEKQRNKMKTETQNKTNQKKKMSRSMEVRNRD